MLATPHASISIVRSRVCFLVSLTVPLLQLRANPKAPVSLLQFLLNQTCNENKASKRNLQNYPCTYMCSDKFKVYAVQYKLLPLKCSFTKPLSSKCEPFIWRFFCFIISSMISLNFFLMIVYETILTYPCHFFFRLQKKTFWLKLVQKQAIVFCHAFVWVPRHRG